MGLSMRKISIISILFSIVIIFGAFQVSAENTDSAIPVLMSSSVALTPGHTGSDYTFFGDYSDGQIRIFAPGQYHCTENLVTTSEDYAIQIENQSITLDGNGCQITGLSHDGIGVNILSEGYNAVITNFSMISDFYEGIYSDGESVSIFNNVVRNSAYAGIYSNGKFSDIRYNFVSDTGDVCIYSFGDNSTIFNNTVMSGRNGILNHGNFADISQNYASNNWRYGICAGGNHVGPEPGENGKGYYAIMKNNMAFLNGYIGLYNWNPHGIIQDNIVIQNADVGIGVSHHSENSTLSGNLIGVHPTGIQITGQANDLILHHNYLFAHNNEDLLIDSVKGLGIGAIFDNYFGSSVNVNGTGQIGNFVWTNPKGPTAGENIMGGPYIAGNYWSNPDGTGWSDLEPATSTGYTTKPYEVISGIYDTAPLVKVSPPPEVINIYPSSGLAGSTIGYLLTGNYFSDGAIVNLTHQGEYNLTSVGSLSGINLTGSIFIPSSAVTGLWNISVNQNGQYSNDNIQFTIKPALPVITNLNPGGAVQNTHSAPFPVIITGTGFDTVSDTNGVTVDGSGISYTVDSPTRINALFPETVDDVPGNHPVMVTGVSGPSAAYNFVVSGTGFTIDAASDGIGWINPSGVFPVTPGSSQTFQFKPTAGAMIKNVTVNGNEVPLTSELTYTIENIDRNYEVRLNCESLPGVIIPAFTVTRLEGNTVRFSNASWGSSTTWKWDFGDRQYGEGSLVEHTYEKPGDYTVSMWARNDISQSQVVGNIKIPIIDGTNEVQFFGP